MSKAVINVEAPRSQVFNVLTDYDCYKDWLPGCEMSKVLSSSGSTSDAELVVNSIKRVKFGLRFEAQPTQSLSFQMVSGKDFKSYTGSYRLMDSADGKGTVVMVEMEIDPGALVPKFMSDRMVKKSLEDLSVALKKRVQTLPPPANAAPTPAADAPKEVPKPGRDRRILLITKTPEGHRVWMLGETLKVRS